MAGDATSSTTPTDVYRVAAELAESCGGHYIDQFTNAALATDWRGNNNIAEAIFEQMRQEPFPVPRWIVVGAGTGGTSATIGRFIRYRGFDTRTLRCRSDRIGLLWLLHGSKSGDPGLRAQLRYRGYRSAAS